MTPRETFFTYLALGVGTYIVSFVAYQTREGIRMLAHNIPKPAKRENDAA